MSYTDNQTDGPSNFVGRVIGRLGQLSQRTWAVIIAIIAFLIVYSLVQPQRPLRPVVDATPYVWPKGCFKKPFYNTSEQISCACKDEKYRIHDWLERGLQDTRKGPDEWYRIDKGAVNISKYDGLFGDNSCHIADFHGNFYIILKNSVSLNSGGNIGLR